VATGADTCGTVTVTESDVETAACGNTKTIVRTWTVTDECGNSTSADQTITVVDTTAPTITVPADVTIECTEDESSANTGVATGADTCGSVTVTESDVETAACGNTKTIVRTWTVTDECGNSTSADQTITVVDTTAPTFTVPDDITIECDVDPTDLTITGDVTDEADNCSANLEASYSDSSANGSCVNEYTITRTWTLTDDCGNTTTLNQTIFVVDTTAPTFTVPADITIECDVDPTDLTITGDVTDENDNCSSGLEATYDDIISEGNCPNTYTIERKWLVIDECENMSSHLQIITVQDTTAPEFIESLPADITVECDAIPETETLTASDNCEDVSVEFSEEIVEGACIGNQIISRTWSATDSCGNTVSHTQIITVDDTTPPALVTPFDEDIIAACDDIPAVPNLVFEDACSNNIEVDFTEESTQMNDFEDYSIIRTWIVTDDCGNSSEFVQNITVEISNIIDAFDANRCILDSEFDLFDLLQGDFDMNGTWSVVSGDATLDGSLFDPGSVELGVYTFKYAITEGPCPTEVEVNVTIDDDCVVLACGLDNVVISKTVTANGDNINDFFEVTGIEDCGFVIELEIYNRWGAKIYESKNYQNDWNGEAHGSSVGGSGFVPTGTYYYVINLRNSGLKPIAGPIYVATNK
jgi:gliding motility-associated-like protein